ncbi:SDR family NAD(P)-dependent oxidoreductase [Williamsia sp. D3]|uniref:SDR family NAD(P)-dependent oxidoreductase n=1 Tax=Williamsia sp. D3 TaxID=1313067 RepID=UPI001F43D71D|nr:SDR family NAD(P)-dependent oxidoreductase [Williamsia sp. D3]
MTTPTVDPTTLRLDGKRALITGATKGIGADIAVTLARAGADLILSGRNKVELDEAAATLSREHARALPQWSPTWPTPMVPKHSRVPPQVRSTAWTS